MNVRQTVKVARNNMRRLAYQVGGHGRTGGRYGSLTDKNSPCVDHYTERTAATGVVFVPWKHPLYWAADGSWIEDLGEIMSKYELSDELFGRPVVAEGDPVPEEGFPYEVLDSVRPKFDSVAAAIMWTWSLDSSQDEDCGDAQYGNGWHALFRDERAILHTDNFGFVTAWRIEDGKDVDEVWAEIEKGAVTEDDDDFFEH